jgi:hypothetical protein
MSILMFVRIGQGEALPAKRFGYIDDDHRAPPMAFWLVYFMLFADFMESTG